MRIAQNTLDSLAQGRAHILSRSEEESLIPLWVTKDSGYWRREDGSGFLKTETYSQGEGVKIGPLLVKQMGDMIPALTFFAQMERMPRFVTEEDS